MKKTEYKIIAFVVFLLIIMIMGLPSFLVAAEDSSLEGKTKSYETEVIDLTPDDTSLKQKLKEISMVYQGNSTWLEAGGSRTGEELKEEIETLLSLIVQEPESIGIDKISAAFCLAPSLDYQSLYRFWDCYAVAENGGEYHVLVDDATGKILSFACPNYFIGVRTEKELNAFADKMETYYGFPLDGVTITYQYKKEFLYFNYNVTETEYQKTSLYVDK